MVAESPEEATRGDVDLRACKRAHLGHDFFFMQLVWKQEKHLLHWYTVLVWKGNSGVVSRQNSQMKPLEQQN